MNKRTKRKVVIHAKWEMPWPDYVRLRWGNNELDFIGVAQTCPAAKRLFRAFGTKSKRLKITIEEVCGGG